MVTGTTVGTWSIVPGAFVSSNFSISYGLGELTIEPATLTVKADDKSATYGESPAFTYTVSGYQYQDADSPVFAGPPVFEVVDAQNAVVNPPGAGSFGVRIQSMPLLQPSNYITQFEQGDLDVAKADLHITADDKSRTYGAANPALTLSYAGFVYNDGPAALTAPTASTSAEATSPAGNYPITLSGGQADNYNLLLHDGNLRIDKANLEARADNKTMVGGTSVPSLTITYTGFVNNEGPSAISQPTIATTATSSSSPGNYPITLTGGASDNYNISLVNGTLTVLTPITCNISMPSTLPLCGIGGNSINATASGGNSYSWNVSSSNNSWSMTGGQNSLCATYQAGSSGVSGTFILTVTNTTYNVSNSCSLTVSSRCDEYCTYVQSFWGSTTATSCTGASSLTLINSALTTPLVNGSGSRLVTIGTSEGSCLRSKMPGGTTYASLPSGCVSCSGATGTSYLSSSKFKTVCCRIRLLWVSAFAFSRPWAVFGSPPAT